MVSLAALASVLLLAFEGTLLAMAVTNGGLLVEVSKAIASAGEGCAVARGSCECHGSEELMSVYQSRGSRSQMFTNLNGPG